MEYGEMDYEKLEGTTIDFTYHGIGGLITEKGLIVGCDPDIGISIVNNDDHDEYFYCLTGPSAPQYPKDYCNVKARAIFDAVALQLKTGVITTDWIETAAGRKPSIFDDSPTSEDCAFV